MDSIDCAKQRIRKIIARSGVPEDPLHAENTLKWLLMLEPKADPALQIAAYAHDIDRAVKRRKVHRSDFTCYEAFKAAHACNGAKILRELLCKCGVADSVTDEACLSTKGNKILILIRKGCAASNRDLPGFQISISPYLNPKRIVSGLSRCYSIRKGRCYEHFPR